MTDQVFVIKGDN